MVLSADLPDRSVRRQALVGRGPEDPDEEHQGHGYGGGPRARSAPRSSGPCRPHPPRPLAEGRDCRSGRTERTGEERGQPHPPPRHRTHELQPRIQRRPHRRHVQVQVPLRRPPDRPSDDPLVRRPVLPRHSLRGAVRSRDAWRDHARGAVSTRSASLRVGRQVRTQALEPPLRRIRRQVDDQLGRRGALHRDGMPRPHRVLHQGGVPASARRRHQAPDQHRHRQLSRVLPAHGRHVGRVPRRQP